MKRSKNTTTITTLEEFVSMIETHVDDVDLQCTLIDKLLEGWHISIEINMKTDEPIEIHALSKVGPSVIINYI